jgi:hypothetical protein
VSDVTVTTPHFRRILSGCLAIATLLALSQDVHADLGTGPSPEHHAFAPHFFKTNGAALEREDFPLQIVTVGQPPDGISTEEWASLVETSVSTWNEVPCSFAELQYAGHRQDGDAVDETDVPIVFDEGQCAPEDLVAWTTFTPCGGYPARAIFLNQQAFEWSVDPQPFQERPEDEGVRIIDVESAVTHELGHVLGLSHPEDRLATMYASYKPDGSMRTLALDDKLGICSLYEADEPADECGAEQPCPDPETCVAAGGFTLCEEFRGSVGDPCGLDQLVCDQDCALVDEETGYCTVPCETDDGCPNNYACVDGFLRAEEAHCARFDPEEPPRGCCSTGVRTRPPDASSLLLIILGMSLLVWRRRPAARRGGRR